MSFVQRCLLALWTVLLAGGLCLGFLPLARLTAVLLLVAVLLITGTLLFVVRHRIGDREIRCRDHLPDAAYRQPVVLVCGDLSQSWPEHQPVLKGVHGCWIRVTDPQAIISIVEDLLTLRPHWAGQLAVMVTVCPQQHADPQALTRRLLALRWQISRIRRVTRRPVPLLLTGLVGSAVSVAVHWQATLAAENSVVWRADAAPCSVSGWVKAGGASALHQQLLINSLADWFQQHVITVFTHENPDMPVLIPAAVLWGSTPDLGAVRSSSLWTAWLQQRTALQAVTGWEPVSAGIAGRPLLPDFILPSLPAGGGLTPYQHGWRCGLTLFTLAAIIALCSSAWNNHQLLQRLFFDIRHYHLIAQDDHHARAQAVAQLRQDAAQLDDYARNGEPLRLGLGLYQGERLRLPILDVIRGYVPPPEPPPEPVVTPAAAPKIVRLNSLSLFASGKATLQAGSTRILVNALVDIKAKPGWLIVVSGHTDNTGNLQLNQTLSYQRARAVRDWMRDTGNVPESCFAVQGYGAARPVALNDTEEGRALNRRVEIMLVPQANACQPLDTRLVAPEKNQAPQ